MASIRTKLYGGFGVLIGLIAVLGFGGWWTTQELWEEFERLYEDNVSAGAQLATAADGLWQLRFGLPQYLAAGPEERSRIVEAQGRWRQQVVEAMAVYSGGNRTTEERDALTEWADAFSRYMAVRPRLFELVAAGKVQEAATWRAETITPLGTRAVAALGALARLQKEVGAVREAEARHMAERATAILILVGVAFVLAALLLATQLARSVLGPLTILIEAADRMASGRVPSRSIGLRRRDELGRLGEVFDGMATGLREILARAKGATRQLDGSSRGLLHANRQLSEGAKAQAEQLDEAASETGSMSTALNELAVTFDAVASRTAEYDESAEAGSRAVAESGKGLDEIREASQVAQATLQSVIQASEKVGDIVEAIGDIAAETHVLSLNASIEATRAGEAGRGFSVVATEVRALADRAGTSAREIRDIVEGIDRQLRAADRAVSRSVEAVERSLQSGDQLTRTFESIRSSARDTHASVARMTAVLKDQVLSTKRTAGLVGDVNVLARGHLEASAQILTQGEALRAVLADLEQALDRFELEASDESLTRRPTRLLPVRST